MQLWATCAGQRIAAGTLGRGALASGTGCGVLAPSTPLECLDILQAAIDSKHYDDDDDDDDDDG